MASPAQIAANQTNSRKSTGPRSPQGRARSSMNALKHGNRSRKLALLREESCAFEDRLCKWMAIGEAQNDVEEYLVYRNVCLSFDLDRAQRARVERCTSLIENSDEEEVALAHAVGEQLFFDPAGPTPLYGNRTFFSPEKKTSWSGQAVDPNNPAALLRILESNAVGCCWLRDEWQALRTQLESTGFWQSHDRLKAIRLLGRQPVQANEDLRVATIFVASHALGPAGPSEFADLRSDMEDSQRSRYAKGIRERWPDLFRTREKAEWRQMLLALAERNIDRLNAKLEVHEQNADTQAKRAVALESFDRSPEGQALANYLIKCHNALHRGVASYQKYHATTSGGCGGAQSPCPIPEGRASRRDPSGARLPGGWDGASPSQDHESPLSGVGRYGTQSDRSEDPGREAHEWDASELGADDSFRSGDGLDDRYERADAIDPDGVEQPGDERNGIGEIGENAPNEANFAETMSIVEAQESIQVTANSTAFSGLDNGVDQPGEESTPEPGNAQGSASENGNPEPQTPDSSDRAAAASLPATVSKREKWRLRLEKERRAVERMVEDKLKAGCISLEEILMSALETPLSGGRGPLDLDSRSIRRSPNRDGPT